MKSKYLSAAVLIVGCCCTAAAVWAFQPPQPGSQTTEKFMKLKLGPAKHILEGIAMADFDSIVEDSERIRQLTLDEGWMVSETDEYRQQSKDFERSVKSLQRAAREKNLDGVTLHYMQMTVHCVECHRHLRDNMPDLKEIVR